MNNSDYIKYDGEGLPISYISKEQYITESNITKGTTLYFINNNEPEVTSITDSYKSSLDELYERIMSELSYKPILEHKCNNCGAPLKMDAENHLFKCRYCGTAYLIGINQIYG